MRILVGTSGYSYPAWKGTFYPRELPNHGMLAYYATRFPAVEINNTFYQMPNPKTALEWAKSVPEGFVFVLKASQIITHKLRLKDAAEATAKFFERAEPLLEKRGPILFQLPPYARLDLDRLRGFLQGIPQSLRGAFEFRHKSWFVPEVTGLLGKHGHALCVADTDEGTTPWEETTDFGYVRLRKVEYTEEELATWAKKLRGRNESKLYVYFKHEDEGRGPEAGLRLQALLA